MKPLEWFRTDTGFMRHPAVVALRRSLRLPRVQLAGHLTILWSNIAEHAPDGDLSGIADETIEEWAEWPDDRPGEFVAQLRTCGWLVGSPENLGGWKKRHAEVLEARERSRKWRQDKAEAKQEAYEKEPLRTVREPYDSVRERNVTSPAGVTVPDRTDETTSPLPPKGEQGVPFQLQPDQTPKPPSPVEELHRVFLDATGRTAARCPLDAPTTTKLGTLIGWAGSLEAAKAGVRAVGASPFHHGENDKRTRYDKLSDAPFRTAIAFRGWIEKADGSGSGSDGEDWPPGYKPTQNGPTPFEVAPDSWVPRTPKMRELWERHKAARRLA